MIARAIVRNYHYGSKYLILFQSVMVIILFQRYIPRSRPPRPIRVRPRLTSRESGAETNMPTIFTPTVLQGTRPQELPTNQPYVTDPQKPEPILLNQAMPVPTCTLPDVQEMIVTASSHPSNTENPTVDTGPTDIARAPPSIKKEDVMCAVCLDIYDDPRLLPCLHTFCKKCLTKTATITSQLKAHTQLLCPTCHTQHELSSGVDNLLVSTQIKADVDKFLSESSKVVTCGLCPSTTQAVKYCHTCDQPLCQLCCESHQRMKTFNSHVVTSPDQAATKKKSITYNCPKHPDEILKIYCKKCEEVICQDCVVYSHQRHGLQPAKEAASDIKGKLKKMVVTMKGKLEKFTSYSETVAKSEKHVTTYPDGLKAAISGKFDKLITELTQRKEELIHSVDTHYDGFSKQLWAEKNKVEMSILGLNAGINFSNKVVESSNGVETAVLGTQALVQMKQLEQKTWDPSTVNILGPIVFHDSSDGQGVDHSAYIRRIGHLENTGTASKSLIEIRAIGYSNFQGSCVNSIRLQSGKDYVCDIQVSHSHSIYPQPSVKHQVTCNKEIMNDATLVKQNNNRYTLKIKTKQAGTYIILVTLEYNNTTIAIATIEMEFRIDDLTFRNQYYDYDYYHGADDYSPEFEDDYHPEDDDYHPEDDDYYPEDDYYTEGKWDDEYDFSYN